MNSDIKFSFPPVVSLSFDLEEFDLPLEKNEYIHEEKMFSVTKDGLDKIIDLTDKHNIHATFFTTTNYALHESVSITELISRGHEIASHGCNHLHPKPEDIRLSKHILEERFNIKIKGYRQPRLVNVDVDEIHISGYRYDSSFHPTCIPGRYNNLKVPRTPFRYNGILEIPVSVTPALRFPVFWLAAQIYPYFLYKNLCRYILRHTGLLVLYFHPWQFVDLRKPELKVPAFIKYNSGEEACRRLSKLINEFMGKGCEFKTLANIAEDSIKKLNS